MLEKFKIKKCKVLKDYNLELSFVDGFTGIINLGHLAGRGVFRFWDNYNEFKKVKIDPITHTICWKNHIDLDSFKIRKDLEKNLKSLKVIN